MSIEFPAAELPYPGERAKCAGGQPIDKCKVMPDLKIGTELPEKRQHRATIQASTNGIENLVYPSVQVYFPLGCVACKVICEAVYEKINGERTDRDPGVFWMSPETYARVRSESLKSMSRLLLASIEPMDKDKLAVTAQEPLQNV